MAEWYDNEYPAQFSTHLKTGRPVAKTFHSEGNKISRFPKAHSEKFNQVFRQRIDRYRNLIHAPDAALIYAESDVWLPRHTFLDEFRTWTDVRAKWSTEPHKFDRLRQIVSNDLAAVFDFIESFWPVLIERLLPLTSALLPQLQPSASAPIPSTDGLSITSIDAAQFGANAFKHLRDSLSSSDFVQGTVPAPSGYYASPKNMNPALEQLWQSGGIPLIERETKEESNDPE